MRLKANFLRRSGEDWLLLSLHREIAKAGLPTTAPFADISFHDGGLLFSVGEDITYNFVKKGAKARDRL